MLDLEYVGDIKGSFGHNYRSRPRGAGGVHDLVNFIWILLTYIQTLPFFSPQTQGLKEPGPGQFEPTFGLLHHPHYLFHFSSCVPLPELADNITKGDPEQNADEDSRS